MAGRPKRSKRIAAPGDRWPATAKRLVRGAARDLKKALDDLWPTREHRPEPERNLVFWVARRLSHKRYRPLFEVNFLGRRNTRLDLVAIKKSGGTAFVVLCEAKNIWNARGASFVAKDFSRLKRFSLRRHTLPKSRVRCLVLVSVWRKEIRDWWVDPDRPPFPEGRERHRGWRRLHKQLDRVGMHLSAVPGGKFEESDGRQTRRWILVATWRRTRR